MLRYRYVFRVEMLRYRYVFRVEMLRYRYVFRGNATLSVSFQGGNCTDNSADCDEGVSAGLFNRNSANRPC